MRPKDLRAACVWWGWVLAVGVLAGAASAQTLLPVAPIVPVVPHAGSAPDAGLAPSAIGDVLRRGRQLEAERRWAEATAHYEDALRQFPGEPSLQQRFEASRLHYDLARRYNDASFRRLLEGLSLSEALAVYSEVLLKIQSHYVETPDWKDLVRRGTGAVEVALSEQPFLDGCRPGIDRQAVDDFCGELGRALGARAIRSRAEAGDAVAAAANLARQRLGVAPSRVVLEYTCGAANSLDLYSTYLTPDQLAEVYSQIEGNFVGLGVELKAQGDALLIVRVISGSPAERSGMRAGQRIVAVDGRPTRDLSTERAANLLQGPAGSVVHLTLQDPDGSSQSMAVRRQRVEVPSVDDVQILDRNQGIGYLKLTCFQKTTAHDLDVALWNLYHAGMRSLIIDLRGNPGGLLVAAVEAADRFVERGVIVSTRGRSFQEDLTYSAREAGTWRVPLVVLVDQDSASAAEIFAGAIRDHQRGTIVGKRSYGKGSVQGIFPLTASGAGVRLTTARFYSPGGRPYNGVGVEPDIVVHQVARPGDGASPARPPARPADPTLAAALQAAQQLMAQR